MHTLATAYSTKQLDALIAANPDWKVESFATSRVAHDANGVRVLSAIKPRGKWSVQVSASVAERMSLPLWKDQS